MEPRAARLEIKARAYEEQREFTREEVVQLLAWSFLGSRFPLSEKGLSLQKRVIRALDGEEDLMELEGELPTVENIDEKFDLYVDLDTTPEEEERFFGEKLSNVQLSKGCSKQCSHCAANASLLHEGGMMPFVAVVKIAKKKREQEEKKKETRVLLDDYLARVNDLFKDVDEKRYYEDIRYRVMLKEHIFKEIFMQHPLSRVLSPEQQALFKRDPRRENLGHMLVYYDSEPFDYRDTSLLHSDGTPADLGDALERLSTTFRPVHITTCGWMPQDRIAQRAAEKMARLGPKRIVNIRVSFSPYSRFARRSLSQKDGYGAYVRSMKQVIETLRPLRPLILFIKDEKLFRSDVNPDIYAQEEGGQEKARRRMMMAGKAFVFLQQHFADDYRVTSDIGQVSRFSGRAKPEGYEPESWEPDIMASAKGIFIHPDGTVLEQGREMGKGVRPLAIERKSIFT
jgi:hypothetical protein